jgi:GSH-dependent disulfide-bond oxidoreductase
MAQPIDLYYWPTPNGWKVTILVEELGIPYSVIPVNLGKGEQFKPEFLEISPNNRMPAIVDHEPLTGKGPLSLFESGAILQYLAEKYDAFLPTDIQGKYEVLQWVYWQMGGLGPMSGQANHFRNAALEKSEYGIKRYTDEVNRLYGVMNTRLADREFLAGEYSIADMMSWPWVVPYERLGQDLSEFPNLKRWFETIKARPAVARGYAIGHDWRQVPPEEASKIMFGQRARQ